MVEVVLADHVLALAATTGNLGHARQARPREARHERPAEVEHDLDESVQAPIGQERVAQVFGQGVEDEAQVLLALRDGALLRDHPLFLAVYH